MKPTTTVELVGFPPALLSPDLSKWTSVPHSCLSDSPHRPQLLLLISRKSPIAESLCQLTTP